MYNPKTPTEISINPVDNNINTNKLAQPDLNPIKKYCDITISIPMMDKIEKEKPI